MGWWMHSAHRARAPVSKRDAESLAVLGHDHVAGVSATTWRGKVRIAARGACPAETRAQNQTAPMNPRARYPIACDTTMLKTIVKHDRLAFKFLDRHSSRCNAVRVLHVRHVAQFLFELERLVVCPIVVCLVSSADDRYANPAISQRAANPLDHGGLAGSSKRDVADADHGDADSLDRFAAVIKLTISPAHGETTGHFGQAGPCHGSMRPPRHAACR